MNDAVRFCDGDDEAARRLMLAMRDERPPAGAVNRALVALGVGSAALLTTGAAAGSGGAGAALSKSLTALAFKWLGAGAAVGLVAATGASVLPRATDQEASIPTAGAAASPVELVPAPRAPQTRAESERVEIAEPAPAPDEPAPAPVARTSTAPARELGPAPAEAQSVARFEASGSPGEARRPLTWPPAADSLEREIELLDQARSAVRANAPVDALAKLDRFAREFPRGRLASEAFVVRLEALVRANRAAEARALAGAHLTRNPSSPHATRIRRIVGAAP
jgi:hypothetical protein